MWQGYRADFMIGIALGGGFTGLLVGTVGTLGSGVPAPIRVTALAIAFTWIILLLMARGADGLPQRRRLVPQEVAATGGGAFQFGFEMGTGFRTYSPSPAPLLLAFVVMINGSVQIGLAAGVAFAAGRIVAATLRLTATNREALDNGFERSRKVLVALGVLVSGACAIAGMA